MRTYRVEIEYDFDNGQPFTGYMGYEWIEAESEEEAIRKAEYIYNSKPSCRHSGNVNDARASILPGAYN